MRISLVNVRIREASNLVPPIGILHLAAVLRKEGFEVQVLDEDPLVSQSIPRIISFNPALIGLGFYTPAYERAKPLARDLKRSVPGAVLCAGGVHATALPEQTAEELLLDFCVLGEGEESLLEVCERLRNGEGYSDVAGLFLRNCAGGTYTPARPLIEDLDALPLPARDALDFRKYLLPPGVFRGHPMSGTTAIITARGCPFQCTYCGSHIMSRGRVRFRSVDSVVAEVEHLIRDYGVKGIFISDESFTLRRNRAVEIARFLKKSGIAWAMQTRVDLLDKDLTRLFGESGCREINFGVESGSQRVLEILRKGITLEQVDRAFSWCREAGISTTANFMLGHPAETMHDIEATFRLARKLEASYTLFHLTTPYPGTEFYRQAVTAGWFVAAGEFNDDWQHRSGGVPLLRTCVPHAELKRLRASYQNWFFARNYLRIRNLPWAVYYGLQSALHPKAFLRAVRNTRESRRLDSLLETFAAETYKF